MHIRVCEKIKLRMLFKKSTFWLSQKRMSIRFYIMKLILFSR